MKPIHIFGVCFLLLLSTSMKPQSAKILYISPDYRTGAVYDKIRGDISSSLRGCLQEKWVREISNTSWDRSPAKNSLLKGLRVNYVLMLDQLPVIKSTDQQIEVSFKLIMVDSTYSPHELTWNNAVYVLELNSTQAPTNVKKVVNNVCEEIDFYLRSSDNPWKRKFRPRIKIDQFVSSGEMEEIDYNAFRKWLNKILEDKYSVDPNYVFYFSRKYDKQFPESSVYVISGQFNKYKEANDNLVSVQLTIEFPDAHDVDAVVIHTEEFLFDDKSKEIIVENIASVLEQEINYYGKE
jgi:hypothetical protein